jgi:hypothetical protein
MKTYIIPAVLIIIFLSGCSSTKSTADYDDVYYSTRADKKAKKNQEELNSTQSGYYTNNDNVATDYYVEDYESGENVAYEEDAVLVESETYQDPNQGTYITNNYYGGSGYDYYDYSYSARINRFYNPYGCFGYYSPYYTGFYYDPYWYGPSFYFGMSWGWGYPYYSYYPYYNNYWYGYNHGYWDGYYAGGGYYDNGNYYYGHRSTGSGSGSYRPTGNRSDVSNISRAGGVENIYSIPTGARGTDIANQNSKSSSLSNTASRNSTGKVEKAALGSAGAGIVQQDVPRSTPTQQKARYTYKKPATTNTSRSNYSSGSKNVSTTQQRTTQKYQKPASSNSLSNNAASRTNTSTRNTQVYSKPKSNSNNSYSRPSQYNTNRSNSSSGNKSYSQPARTNKNSYSTPSRTNTRSYSSPSRSSSNNRSYSSPSRSSNSRSYSTPSRSGSSGSSRSSSSSGGSRSSSSGGRR